MAVCHNSQEEVGHGWEERNKSCILILFPWCQGIWLPCFMVPPRKIWLTVSYIPALRKSDFCMGSISYMTWGGSKSPVAAIDKRIVTSLLSSFPTTGTCLVPSFSIIHSRTGTSLEQVWSQLTIMFCEMGFFSGVMNRPCWSTLMKKFLYLTWLSPRKTQTGWWSSCSGHIRCFSGTSLWLCLW